MHMDVAAAAIAITMSAAHAAGQEIAPADLPPADLSLSPVAAYGEPGDTHLSFAGALGLSTEEDASTDLAVLANYHRFLAQNVEFIGELGLFHYNQIGDNTVGINPGFNLRYHYINADDWSLYADAGIGVIISPDDVPDGGTSFNFTPRVGLGFTKRLNDAGLRVITGARWHHVSNARIEGDGRNPDRDGVLIYAGLGFPI